MNSQSIILIESLASIAFFEAVIVYEPQVIFKSSLLTIPFFVEVIFRLQTQFKLRSSLEKITQLVFTSQSSTNSQVTSKLFSEFVVVIKTLSASTDIVTSFASH